MCIKSSAPCWVEIKLNAVGHNTAQVKELIGSEVKLMAVVKSNAYGHGLIPVAQTVLGQGADALGVTHLEEGIALREAGIDVPVLVFRPLLPGEQDAVLRFGLTTSVSSLAQAELLSEAALRIGVNASVHLKIETGMGRTGFVPESLMEVAELLFSLPGLEWEGIYTHFASAAGDPSFTRQQFQIFQSVVQDLAGRGIHFSLRHVCNSTAALLYPEMRLDMVRVGTLLYGQFPAGVRNPGLDLQETWSFWTRILHLQQVRRGMTVGYGRTYRVKRDTVLAVLPVGYRDGFGLDVQPRPAGLWDLTKVVGKLILSYLGFPVGSHYVYINNIPAPVVGRIGMELSCIDVGKITDIGIGIPVRIEARRTVVRASIPRLYQESSGEDGGVKAKFDVDMP